MAPDLQPHLVGELVELRPLAPADWPALFAVASDPLIWEQHPARDRGQESVFRAFFAEALASGGALVVIDRSSREVIGSTRFANYNPGPSELEIGWTFLARRCWGRGYNQDMKRLMLAHAFGFVERVVFLVGEFNVRSQRAVERIGGVRTGVVEGSGRAGGLPRSIRYEIRRPGSGDSGGGSPGR